MYNLKSFICSARKPLMVLILIGALAGCESKQDKAIDQARKQAAATGQPQQVVSVDKGGTTTTTIVQPPGSRADEPGDDDDDRAAAHWRSASSALGPEDILLVGRRNRAVNA